MSSGNLKLELKMRVAVEFKLSYQIMARSTLLNNLINFERKQASNIN